MTDPRYLPAPRTPELGDEFFDVVEPARFPRHTLRFRNQRWAERLGLGALGDDQWVDHFARFRPLPDNLPRPLALRYHGHQFGSYNPHLGDGRGFLFAQLSDPVDGRLLDLATKGSGKTPWSRTADGRLTLKGGVREILATEMLEALGVYTSKSFSLVETGEALVRGDEPSPTRSSVLVRLSHSHVRFGTFQRLAYQGDVGALSRLCDFTLANYFPELSDGAGPARLFEEICRRSATLCASWMAAGFVHGVLNTDNMNVTGESFDYGPWRFLPHLDPSFTAAYFDDSRLYAYGRQPAIVRWNLERLAEALAPLVPRPQSDRALVELEARYLAERSARFLARLGIEQRGAVPDLLLSGQLDCFLERSRIPFDRFFFDWYGGERASERALAGPHGAAYAAEDFSSLRALFAGRLPTRPEALADAYFQGAGPTTMQIEEVERVWSAIAERDDWGPLDEKIAEVRALGALYGVAM
ncbi:MAG: hypothetical protein JWN44_4671 [Myxococcales bacterium]|nr:hypothetical protein [Myxococcales bacterium]